MGPFALRPDHLGLSRPGADSGLWEFLKLELMRTGGSGCLGAGGRAQQSGPSAVSCLEGMTSSLPSTACVSTPLLSVLLGGGTDRPASGYQRRQGGWSFQATEAVERDGREQSSSAGLSWLESWPHRFLMWDHRNGFPVLQFPHL